MTEFIFDQWLDLYAPRVSQMKPSAIRELLAVTARPDIISFAGGLPDTRTFPVHQIAEAAQRVMLHEGAAAMNYGPSEGHEGLKRHIVEIMQDIDISVDMDDFIIVDGAQQGLEFLGKILIGEGDTVIVEGPSYIGALQAFAAYGPELISIPMDDNGMQVDVLELRLAELKALNIRPKFLYTIPNFQNPAGVTLSLERRKRIIELAQQYKFLVVEDDPYGKLRFDGEPIQALRSMDENVIYLGTMSKIFSPGMRLGWVIAPRPILDKLVLAKQAANLCSGSFAQWVTEEYMNMFDWRKNVDDWIVLYRDRRDAMLAALAEYFPEGSTWTHPHGGLFIWATVPEGIDTKEMLAEAIRVAKVAYVPGSDCFANGVGGKSCMRLNFSYCPPEKIDEGIKQLGAVVKSQLELYRSLFKGHKPKS